MDPALAAKGDGEVVDAILAIDTDRPSLKPLYRSAVQVRSSRVRSSRVGLGGRGEMEVFLAERARKVLLLLEYCSVIRHYVHYFREGVVGRVFPSQSM